MTSPTNDNKVAGSKGAATAIGGWTLFGVIVIALIFGGLGGWGATAPLSGAVVAPGSVIVDTNAKAIQHLEGGIVGDIRVRDGDAVEEGSVLIALDETQPRATLQIVRASLDEELAKEARLKAERDGTEMVIFAKTLLDRADNSEIQALLDGQNGIFEARRRTRAGTTQILEERIGQLREEIVGLRAQQASVEKQSELIAEELKGLMQLYERGQTTLPRILALQREAARLDGQKGSLIASVARAGRTIGETQLQILQQDKAFQEEVVAELRDVQASTAELRERLVAAEDTLRRTTITAPVGGKVVRLAVHAPGAVIRPGDTVLEIVPTDDRLLVEVQVAPQDVDNVALGQPANVRFTAFKQRTTPTVEGAVTYVSPDSMTDERTGMSYFLARIDVPEESLVDVSEEPMQPGMPAEAMIRTGERTAIDYLTQPIVESMNRAWRED